MTSTRAAVWDGENLELTDDLIVRDPAHDEVQVALAASGICHSDLNVIDGIQPLPPPVVLGHEGAGTVVAVGSSVDHHHIGDRVLIASMTPCGRCRACAQGHTSRCRATFGRPRQSATLGGVPVRTYASVGSFAGLADQVITVPGTIPLDEACLVGCAVTTAYGSVRHLGEVDIDPRKQEIAERFGATDVIIESDGAAVVDRLRSTGGVDVAIECSGAPAAIEAAIAALAPGGTAVLVGIPPPGARPALDVVHLLDGRRIVGGFNGAVQPHADIPAILSLVATGQLDLAGLVTDRRPLGEIDAAIESARSGSVVRAVVLHDRR